MAYEVMGRIGQQGGARAHRAEKATPEICARAPLRLARLHQPSGMLAFQRLEAGPLVRREPPFASGHQTWCGRREDGQSNYCPLDGFLRLGMQPVTTLVRLEY